MASLMQRFPRRSFVSLVFLASISGFSSLATALDAGVQAPDFSLPGTVGTLKLSDFKGKVVYLDFWASWCGPCKQSFPWMNALEKKYAAQGLKVIAVNVDAKSADGQQFLKVVPAEFAVAFDPNGSLPKLYGVKGMPSSLIIGRDGKVLSQHIGFNPAMSEKLEASLQSALRTGE